METVILQKLKLSSEDKYRQAEKYYSILSAINNLHLTERELQLIAFTAIHGNMSYAYIREEFCAKYSTTNPTINNIISKLKKMKVLVKESGKIKVNPMIILDFEKEIKLAITLNIKENGAV